MTNYAARGNSFDLVVAKDCAERGGLVASRRHTGGAGDLLVVWPDLAEGTIQNIPSLIECKTCKRSPYENFRRDDREAMKAERDRFDGRLSLWLAWRRTGTSKIEWAHEAEWPKAKVAG